MPKQRPRGVGLKRSGGRLKQDLDKDFLTIYAYIHVHSHTSEKLSQWIFGLVLRYRYSCLSVFSISILILLH